jgi:hypothetical protein
MPDPDEQDSYSADANQRTVDVLRETFAVVANRLTPEVEPATMYLPYAPVSHASRPVENAE